MTDHELELAAAQTKIVLFTERHINTQCFMKVDDAAVQTDKAVKYLGVMLNTKLTFGEQILKVSDKAAEKSKI